MDVKVSVIIPVYNAERTVLGAVDSALAQTLGDIEVIVVDDGSTDGTRALLERTYGTNEKVRLLFQERNAGVGAARNRGLAEASGEYISFLDSDDAQRSDMLERMFVSAKECDADVLHTTGFLMPAVPAPDDLNTLDGKDLKEITLDRRDTSEAISFAPGDAKERLEEWCAHRYHWGIWNKLFSKRFLREHGLLFDAINLAEDMLFCLKALYYAERYAVLPGAWYVYRTSGETLSRQRASVKTVTALTEKQLRAAEAARRFVSSEGFFADHPVLTQKIYRTVCNTIGLFYIHPALKALSVEQVQEDGGVSSFFAREFGEKSAYVEFLYWRIQELTGEGFDLVKSLGDAGEFEKMSGQSKKRRNY